MTNFEKIKSMSIEEMADFLSNIDTNIYTDIHEEELIFSCCLGNNNDIEIRDTYGDIKRWLESEVE